MSAVHPRIVSVVVDATDARRLGEFYRELLGYEYRLGSEPPSAGESDVAGQDWLVLRDPERFFHVCIQQVRQLQPSTWPEPDVPQQLHLDMEVTTVAELDRQRARVVALGGRILHDRTADTDEPLYVFADPDGHPFCVFVGPPEAHDDPSAAD